MGVFADLVTELKIPPTTTLQEILENPDLDKGVLRQRDYTLKLNEWQAAKQTLEEQAAHHKALADKWETWKANHWDPDKGMTRKEAEKLEELETLRAQVAAGVGGQGEEMDFGQIRTQLDAAGYVNKSTIKDLLTEQKVVTEEGQIKLGQGFQYIYAKVTPLLLRYQKEFGEDADGAEFMEGFLNHLQSSTDNLADPKKAYDAYVAPKRLELQSAALKRERDEWEAQKVAEQAAANQRTPTDVGAPLGHLERTLLGKDKPAEDAVVAPLGSLRTAAIAAERYRTTGTLNQQQ